MISMKNSWNIAKLWCILTNGIVIFNYTLYDFVEKCNLFMLQVVAIPAFKGQSKEQQGPHFGWQEDTGAISIVSRLPPTRPPRC